MRPPSSRASSTSVKKQSPNQKMLLPPSPVLSPRWKNTDRGLSPALSLLPPGFGDHGRRGPRGPGSPACMWMGFCPWACVADEQGILPPKLSCPHGTSTFCGGKRTSPRKPLKLLYRKLPPGGSGAPRGKERGCFEAQQTCAEHPSPTPAPFPRGRASRPGPGQPSERAGVERIWNFLLPRTGRGPVGARIGLLELPPGPGRAQVRY